MLDEFEKRTGADVTFVPAQDPIINFLGTKIAGKQPPDVAMIPQVGAVQQAAAKKWAKPVGAEAKAQLDEELRPGLAGPRRGRRHPVRGVFQGRQQVPDLVQRRRVRQRGGERAEDLEGLPDDRGDRLASGVTPVSVGGADGWTLTDWFENVYLSQAGPEKYDQLAKHEIPWTDPSVKDALTTLAELFGKPELIAGGADGALQTEFPASVTQTFTGGDQPKGAMVFEGDFVAVNIAQTEAKIGTDAKVFPFPAVGADSPW